MPESPERYLAQRCAPPFGGRREGLIPRVEAGDTVKYLTGNVKNREAVQAGLLLGPVAGGALVAATRAPTVAFAVDAASFGISALTSG
jgi:hypothetical protein